MFMLKRCMVPCIFLCGPVENMLGPVKCGSKLALDQKKSGNFQRCRNSLQLITLTHCTVVCDTGTTNLPNRLLDIKI
jgi:hypothetical protein